MLKRIRLGVPSSLVSVVVATVLAGGAHASDPSCGRPFGAADAPTVADALYTARALSDLDDCRLAVCDADGNGALTAADVGAILLRTVDASAPLSCPLPAEPSCGQPVTAGSRPTAIDAQFVLRAAVGIRACAGDVCDVDDDDRVGLADAQAIVERVSGAGVSLTCPIDGGRAVPPQGGCNNLLTVDRCRLRTRVNRPRHKLRVVCSVHAPNGFPTGFDPASQSVMLAVRDTDGPCFADVIPPNVCVSRANGHVCRLPKDLGGLSLVRFRVKPRYPDRFTMIALAERTQLGCLDRLSSPWTVSVLVGDDCGEIGCPVTKRRLDCPGGCGNGAVDSGEQCDGGGESSSCDRDCTLPVCGDGTLNFTAGEQCDDGEVTPRCDANCEVTSCGDGVTDPGEDCDDAGESAACDADCTFPACGDGTTNFSASEQCDDAGASSSCDADCTLALCGDGTRNPAAGEACDLTDLGGATCADFGFSGGQLGCTSMCAYNATGCTGGGGPFTCDVTFGVTSTSVLGSLQYDVDYSAAIGEFVGSAGTVDCTRTAGDFGAFNDVDAQRDLISAFISASGFATPADVATCRFSTNDPSLVAEDFAITVTDAAEPDLTPVNAVVEITSLDCPGVTTTTTTTTTTVSGPTTTMPAGTEYDVEFVLQTPVTLGALQFSVDYSSAPGDFVGSGGDTSSGGSLQCSVVVTGTFFGANDCDTAGGCPPLDENELSAAFVSLSGFSGPQALMRCLFATTGPVPVAADFHVSVSDASDPNLNPVTPLPTVGVGSITQQ